MLEYGFNELDNDFVTLWSKKIVSGEDSLIFRDLTKLAELGQINAIQSWYLLAKNGDDNFVIDNIVDNLGNGGANELLAVAHKDMFKNDRWKQISEFYALNKIWDTTEIQDERLGNLEFILRNSDYISKLELATDIYKSNYITTLNILMLERYYEMIAARTKAFEAASDYNIRISKREFKKLRKTLLERYDEDKNNVAIAFALGKNLTLFKSSALQTAMGSRILTELSNRELSQTLQNYEIKGTKRLIKQQIDANAQAEFEAQNMSAQDRYIQEVFERARKAEAKFSGNHGVDALTPEQIGIVESGKQEKKGFNAAVDIVVNGRDTTL